MASGAIFISHDSRRADGILPVLTFDPNEPPVSRFTRGKKIDGAFDQEFFDCYTRIYDSFPALPILAAHQLITPLQMSGGRDGTGTHHSNRLWARRGRNREPCHRS